MTKSMLIIAILFFFNFTNAQELKETYFNYASGSIKESGYIDKNGYPIGEWKYYLENGSIDYTIDWDTKSTKEYYTTGELKEIRTFNPNTGVRIGEWASYYKNGNTRAEGIYDENGMKNGKFKTYSENGTLKRTTQFKAGEKQE